MQLVRVVDTAVAVLLCLSAALLPAVRCDPQAMMAMVSLCNSAVCHCISNFIACAGDQPWSDTDMMLHCFHTCHCSMKVLIID
jgi:hypothetical protein